MSRGASGEGRDIVGNALVFIGSREGASSKFGSRRNRRTRFDAKREADGGRRLQNTTAPYSGVRWGLQPLIPSRFPWIATFHNRRTVARFMNEADRIRRLMKNGTSRPARPLPKRTSAQGSALTWQQITQNLKLITQNFLPPAAWGVGRELTGVVSYPAWVWRTSWRSAFWGWRRVASRHSSD